MKDPLYIFRKILLIPHNGFKIALSKTKNSFTKCNKRFNAFKQPYFRAMIDNLC